MLMDYLSLIRQPITSELARFSDMFSAALTHDDGLLSQALGHIRSRVGKRMRPMLILLIAKNYGQVTDVTQHAAIGLELLHTASLIHDDVVDESSERRGQASVNALYNNKVSVLVGDYVLSTALLHVSLTGAVGLVRYMAELGRTLSDGEILQLSHIDSEEISEETYYSIIRGKTAALFEACARIGAHASGASEREIAEASDFGRSLGMIFQIRDDIFDYYDSPEIGKPTGNDMAEGKLTLPVIHALLSTGNEEMRRLAMRVRSREISSAEIARLVAFTKEHGGIEYAEQRMWQFHADARQYIDSRVGDAALKTALRAYLDFMIERDR